MLMKKLTSLPSRKFRSESKTRVQRIISLSCALGIMTLGSFVEAKVENSATNNTNVVAVTAPADGRTITGVVKDQNGEPLTGVVVRVKGTQTGTTTDGDGKYVLTKVQDGSQIVFSFVGMTAKTVALGSQSKIDVLLEDESTGLNEVVVTGLGIKRENKSLGYAMATVSASDIVKTGTPTFATALYGKLSGVRIQAAPGGSTSAIAINVRGLNSITGTNQPLIIVNGVPIRNGEANNSDYWTDQRINSNGLVDINPEDIENISVLKGASAAALYGSEGANGVVMITTKSGKSVNGIGVDFSATISGDWVAYMPQYQTTFGPGVRVSARGDYEKQTGGFWERTYNGQKYKSIRTATANYGPKYDGSDILYYDGTVRKYAPVSENPWSEVFRTGINQTYNLGITQGNEKGNMRFSYTYVDNLPTQYNSTYKKHNFNLTGSYSLNKQLKLDYSINYILQDIKNRPYRISRLTNNFGGMFNAWDDVKYIREHTVTSLGYMNVSGNAKTLTPNESFIWDLACGSLVSEYFWNIFGKERLENSNRLIANLTPSWKIMDGLTLQGRISTDYTGNKAEDKEKTDSPILFGSYSGAYGLANSRYQIVYGDILLMFNRNLTEKVGLIANAGWQGRTEDYYYTSVRTNGGLSNENWFNLNASKLTPESDMGESHFLKHAYLGTASLSWDNFWFVEGTIRYERASSIMNKGMLYPSANTSLIYSEALRKKLPAWYDYGKVRLSYGKVGNSPLLYQAQESYNQGSASGYIYNTVPSDLGNNYIKPENKYEFEIGLENKFFKNRLGFEATFYSNKIVDQILRQDMDPTSGATSKLLNVGEVRNKGYEFTLYGTPVLTKDLRWDLRGNISFNRNKVTKLNDGGSVLTHQTLDGGAVSIESHVGEGMGDIYAYAPKTDDKGNCIVGTDGFYKLTDERVKVANAMPKAIGGVSSSLTFKNFTLDLSMDFRIGGAVLNTPYQYLMGRGSLKETMDHRDAEHGGLPFYFNNNDGNNAPSPGNAPTGLIQYNNGMILPGVKENGSANDIVIESDRWYNWTYNWGVGAPTYYSHAIFDNSYVKMREIALSYQLPKSITSKFSCRSLSLSVFARNPFYIYKKLPIFDAEATDGTNWVSQTQIGGSTATTRTFGGSIRIAF